ncbi:MAG: hypothetical protein ACP5MG_07245 [Verrucomicrobiia bacterium]
MGGWHICNIINLAKQGAQLWQFTAAGKNVRLSEELSTAPSEPLPHRLFKKSWGSLLTKKFNIAYLPPEQVFIRVIQLPAADFNETLSMVEFQLEQLSPIPVTQIGWAIHTLPSSQPNEQTVVVFIAPKNLIESQLGKLEENGYFADRLETPLFDTLFSYEIGGDSVWIYPVDPSVNKTMWISAWWINGALRHIGVINVLENDKESLKRQLLHIFWGGELEGWYDPNIQLRWHIVAPEEEAKTLFEPVVSEISAGNYESHPLPEPRKVAELTAKRLLEAKSQSTLVPQEYTERYKQQFIDRLWMSGVGAAILVYLIGVLIYFGYVEVLKFKYNQLQSKANALSAVYTNTLAVKAQIQVLEDQLSLKNAVLDAYYAVVINLPEELTLNSLSFSRAKTITIFGTAPSDQNAKVTEYNGILGRLEQNGQKLFSKVSPPTISLRGQNITWSFNCELNRTEVE